jgi:hypothetical protein
MKRNNFIKTVTGSSLQVVKCASSPMCISKLVVTLGISYSIQPSKFLWGIFENLLKYQGEKSCYFFKFPSKSHLHASQRFTFCECLKFRIPQIPNT